MLIVYGFVVQPCLLIIPAYLNIPFVVLTPEVMPDHHRIPHLPSFIGNLYNEYSDKITFLERLHNMFLYFQYANTLPILIGNGRLLSEYGSPDFKSMIWKQMLREAQLIICIRDHVLDSPKPTMPYLIFISGIVDKPNPLPNETEMTMNSSAQYGVMVQSPPSGNLGIPSCHLGTPTRLYSVHIS
jgi:hypothetical protein